mmetsp:Transcript_4993/g.10775  ORF Transcript_4993/g.10775 Transcript_4993/m.10775 type:complete len:150 (-) Transcript_4993:2102-2551(-)|eukprot:CAMPEP_0202889648 /NCGR_PEP_ID=MMETSP1392-20130828/241_1 /ASSEMBLY_ACC=CAM_ASM_000868 /TAXON_ID=225041 /ORGANISM="Chlamydomonas chlamydogama, Strain SAG 11-48b" /LENGTH=149 /DNA_ID=CAMNT_0049573027 /DNA_START=127 /DNA_END=576 /DNA_ORIENTATION=+
MATNFSQDRIAELKEAFSLFDRDGDGCITAQELGTVLRAVGKSPTEAEVKTVLKDVDPDGRGLLDFNEFMSVMSKDIKNFDNEADLRDAWKVFDKDSKGFISISELKHVLSNIGEKLSPEEMDDLVKEADPTSSGKVVYEEFVKMMMAK